MELYFRNGQWQAFQQGAALIYGLGPSAYDARRFGASIAATRPPDLHAVSYIRQLGPRCAPQKDVMVRVSSSALWFNQQMCRWLWRRLQGRIGPATLEAGYAMPNGKATTLGGFEDGPDFPSPALEQQAVFLKAPRAGGTYFALFKIAVNEEAFTGLGLEQQQQLVGRKREGGDRIYGTRPNSHRRLTDTPPARALLRQGFEYDDGPGKTGVYFGCSQASLTRQLEPLMMRMIGAGAHQGFMKYLTFLSAGYYYLPPAPAGYGPPLAPN
jgi:deferrochelatase/peroxidase EfeB